LSRKRIVPAELRAVLLHEPLLVVVAIEERRASSQFAGKALARTHQNLDDGAAIIERWQRQPRAAVPGGERRFVRLVRGDDHRDSRKAQCAGDVQPAEQHHGRPGAAEAARIKTAAFHCGSLPRAARHCLCAIRLKTIPMVRLDGCRAEHRQALAAR
jgi:hypothetical protein